MIKKGARGVLWKEKREGEGGGGGGGWMGKKGAIGAMLRERRVEEGGGEEGERMKASKEGGKEDRRGGTGCPGREKRASREEEGGTRKSDA
jgi:hypothetical protein